MPHTAVVTFTARNLEWILDDGGSRDWRLDADRARRSEFLVCTQNCHNTGADAPTAAHGHAFLIGRISDVVPSPDRPDRWLIKISDYVGCDIPDIWGKFGHLRYPVWYTTLEELGIDLAVLPPFRQLPPRDLAGGFADAVSPPPIPPKEWPPREWPAKAWPSAEWAAHERTARLRVRKPAPAAARPPAHGTSPEEGHEAWARLDAILAQLDRVPDLSAPTDPLDWDEHGLPR